MRSHTYLSQRRQPLPTARSLTSETITILSRTFDEAGRFTGEYAIRVADVPARLYRATGEQVYTEDTLRLEYGLSFQIRDREVGSDDLVEFNGRAYSIQAIIPLVPGAWLQLDLTAPDA